MSKPRYNLVMSYPSNPSQDFQPSGQPIPLDTPTAGGPVGVYNPPNPNRTREFPRTYDTSPDVPGPMGPMNIGYSHNVVSKNAQWARGELPPLGYNYAFALRRPRFMREPRTDLGTYNLAKG